MENKTEFRINENVLCLLKFIPNSNLIIIAYEPIIDVLKIEFQLLLKMYLQSNTTAKEIVRFIKSHNELKVLFYNYNFCKFLNRSFQGLYSNEFELESKYISDFKHSPNKLHDLKKEKEALLEDCKDRALAYSLDNAYAKCLLDNSILAYSHRKVGWSAPKYQLNNSFSIEFKTNFGYGSVSYFYTKIKYKGLDIIPFADWVKYPGAKIYEIVLYSAKHSLTNESWLEAMEFSKSAYNLSVLDEKGFIKKYIIDECDKLTRTLDDILVNSEFKFEGLKFLNQERGYVDLEKYGHNLVEFRGEKISGALGFISLINQFSEITDIKHFITKIENCNITLKPILVDEITLLDEKVLDLNVEITALEPIYQSFIQRNSEYDVSKNQLKDLLLSTEEYKGKILLESTLEERFCLLNSAYDKFKSDFGGITSKHQSLTGEIFMLNLTLKNLKKYLTNINDYFQNSSIP